MKVAVFSDIHGNCVALDAVLADLKRDPVDSAVCLGDATQGGLQPRQVIDRLREMSCPVILGNADDFVLTASVKDDSVETPSEALKTVSEWTLGEIGPEGVEFLKGFVPTYSMDLEGGKTLLCFHGSPRSFNEVLLPESTESEVNDALAGAGGDLLTGGHTHLQWTRPVRDKTFFNPGSVGVVYNRKLARDDFYIYPFAEYSVVTSIGDEFNLEFRQIPYATESIKRVAAKSSHPFAESEASKYTPPEN